HIESAVEADAQAVEAGQPARGVDHRFTSLASLETVERAAGSGHVYRHAEVGQMCERSGYPALVPCGVCCVELFEHSVELVGAFGIGVDLAEQGRAAAIAPRRLIRDDCPFAPRVADEPCCRHF